MGLYFGVAALLALTCSSDGADSPVSLIFMEPVAGGGSVIPTYRRVEEPARVTQYEQWLGTEAAKRALELYAEGWKVMQDRGEADDIPPFHIALVPGGNHAASGFRLRDDSGVASFPDLPYIKVDPSDQDRGMTFLHETGHVVLGTLAGADGIPARPIASIPHSTAALTDRSTAFNEGFSIHLETLAAHLATDPAVRDKYHHESMDFESKRVGTREYYRPASDIATYAQTLARYHEVRENYFAFASAYNEPNYLRVQLDKSRDFATLRDANQLLQSEGFMPRSFSL